MAASTTPTGYAPKASETDFRLRGWQLFQFSIYVDGDNLAEQEVTIWDSAGTTQLWTSGLLPIAAPANTDGLMLIYPERVPLASGVAYKWAPRVRGDATTVSAYGTKISFTMGAAPVTAVKWRASQ